MTFDPAAVKQESERTILSLGGQICEWLPHLDPRELALRPAEEVADRALALNALLQVAFGAPRIQVLAWLSEHRLVGVLTDAERDLLDESAEPTNADLQQLRWHLETLGSLAWALGLLEDLHPIGPVPDQLAACFPDLRAWPSPAPFRARMALRGKEAICRKADLLYRAHWYAHSARMVKADPAPFDFGVAYYRRLPLEWCLDPDSEWDEVDMST